MRVAAVERESRRREDHKQKGKSGVASWVERSDGGPKSSNDVPFNFGSNPTGPILPIMTNRLLLPLLFLFAAILPLAAGAETLTGRVVKVADGDTVTLLDANHQQHRIRLAGIDAPEKAQPFGQRSKERLGAMAFGKTVAAECGKHDRYGRVVCKILVAGRDACLDQVKSGMAWHYRAYEREQTPADRVAYGKAEREARAAGRGLWRDAVPVPPWDWRKARRPR